MESLAAVMPITVLVFFLTVSIVPMSAGNMMTFLFGAFMLVVGMGMFQLGADMAMSRLGEGMGISLSRKGNIVLIALATFLLGALITIAEPDLRVLSDQVPAIPTYTLIITVALGVGLFLVAAVLRIAFKVDLGVLLTVLYLLVIGFSFIVPEQFLSVAFDSGGVTTGPITVPFIMAFGVGVSTMRNDKDASNDSFGLVSLASVGPILAVLVLSCFFGSGNATYVADAIQDASTMKDVVFAFAEQTPHYALEVLISMFPILGAFFVLQLITKRYKKAQIFKMLVGFLYTYVGLVLFLCGVSVGFAPVGSLIGAALGGDRTRWLLVPVGMLIGYFIVKAEPAIQILNKQVQSVTNGTISAKSMNVALQIGVSVSVGLAMLRVITGLPIRWIVIPGYVLALVMTRLVPKIFVGIAFDSGGVASGPMTSTFLLPLCIGACQTVGGDIMSDAFGAVALVALTPLIAIQMMGVIYNVKMYKIKRASIAESLIGDDSDTIIEFEEA